MKAVAVEENPDGEGLAVRIAANSGDLSVNFMHQARRRGRISRAQVKACTLNRESIAKIESQKTVARSDMSSSRILALLRSKHAPNTLQSRSLL